MDRSKVARFLAHPVQPVLTKVSVVRYLKLQPLYQYNVSQKKHPRHF